jgi:hypothetical protein
MMASDVDSALKHVPLDRLLIQDDGIKVQVVDPIDGGPVLRNDSRDHMFDWCADNCRGKFWIGMGFGRFELQKDAVAFSMRWG